jgi:hypothetical protein
LRKLDSLAALRSSYASRPSSLWRSVQQQVEESRRQARESGLCCCKLQQETRNNMLRGEGKKAIHTVRDIIPRELTTTFTYLVCQYPSPARIGKTVRRHVINRKGTERADRIARLQSIMDRRHNSQIFDSQSKRQSSVQEQRPNEAVVDLLNLGYALSTNQRYRQPTAVHPAPSRDRSL